MDNDVHGFVKVPLIESITFLQQLFNILWMTLFPHIYIVPHINLDLK